MSDSWSLTNHFHTWISCNRVQTSPLLRIFTTCWPRLCRTSWLYCKVFFFFNEENLLAKRKKTNKHVLISAMDCHGMLQLIEKMAEYHNEMWFKQWCFFVVLFDHNQYKSVILHKCTFFKSAKSLKLYQKNEFASEALDNWRFPCKAPLTLFVCRLVRRWIKDVALLGYRLTWHSVRESKAATSLQCLETFPPLRLCTRQGYCQQPLWKHEKMFISCSACWL